MKKFLLFLLLIGSYNGLWANSNFYDDATQAKLKRYFLPQKHTMKPVLDKIFKPGVLNSADSFERAGFTILLHKRSSHAFNARWVLARHPLVPGYLFKVFLNNEQKLKKNECWNKLLDRCKGAERIRNLIKEKGLQHFIVPDKWLYAVPPERSSKLIQQPVVLMVTDMHLVAGRKNRMSWKRATKEQLDELYTILSHGYGSTFLTGNLPYTKWGKFACIDTEGPVRRFEMEKVKAYLSEEMGLYWDKLMQKRPQFVGKN